MSFQIRNNDVQSMLSPQDMRDALARFATGVAVVTTQTDTGPLGMTINSFSSVSLDPPLVLWSLAKSSNRTKAFETAQNFAVHILANTQGDLCRAFAKEGDAFDTSNSTVGDNGVPILENCIARFDCSLHVVYEGGDHLIFVARVEAVSLENGDPLVYYDRAFGVLQRENAHR